LTKSTKGKLKLEEKKEVIITQEGYKKLEKELDYLTNVKRKEVAKRIKQAIEFGDLSENSEYEDAKNEQAFVEGRIGQIKELLSRASFIDDKKIPTDSVAIGSKINLRDMQTNEKLSYLLVGFAEADPANHKISNESPVGRAILGKKPKDIVEVQTPEGTLKYRVISISKNSHKSSKKKNKAKKR